MGTLANKVAVVTGASKGIGASIAQALAAQGASVVVNYSSSQSGAQAVIAAITQHGGEAIAVKGDVSSPAGAQAIIEAAIARFGKLDVLVNNSGVYEFGALDAITPQNFHRMFDINVLGLLLTTQAAAKHMRAGGSIINIGSVVSHSTPPNSAVYSATKGAVDSITGVLAKELGAKQIRVNSINPGMVVTEGARSAGIIGSDLERAVMAQTPLGRIGQPGDIANVAVFLASEASAWVTGEKIAVGGGMH